MCGFIAQLVEHRTGIAEVTGSNSVEALTFFRLLLSSCLNWKIYCNDHPSLTTYTVGHSVLRTFGHPVVICCDMLGVVSSNLKMVKFFVQHLWMTVVVA